MSKLDNFLAKIGWQSVPAEEQETYKEPKSAVYSPSGAYRGNSDSEIHLTFDEPEGNIVRSSVPRPRPQETYSEDRTSSGAKVVNLHANVQMEVVVASPESFDEAKGISDDLRNNKPVVINLEFVEHPIAQRITDFLCGACYAMGGNVQQIADKIYMIAPGNVDIAASSDFRRTLQNESGLVFPWGREQQ